MPTHDEIKAFSTANPHRYCEYEGIGKLVFDPLRGTKHFDPWWMLVQCDDQITCYYAWFLRKYGRPVWVTRLWGTHVSVVKHEEPPNLELWGKIDREVRFHYTNYIRSDNGLHAWLDCYSPELSEVRQELGLPAKEWFHMTIGRLC